MTVAIGSRGPERDPLQQRSDRLRLAAELWQQGFDMLAALEGLELVERARPVRSQ
jgi:hypothetical protein